MNRLIFNADHSFILFDEYKYKVLFIVAGILYWVYGLGPYMNILLKGLIVLSLVPMAINMAKADIKDYRLITAYLIMALGLVTCILTVYKRPTFTLLLYILIKITVLGYCSDWKSSEDIKNEIDNLFRIIVMLGTVILAISLLIYIMGISKSYFIGSEDGGSILYLGVNPDRNSLCGIFANENMISNLCCIYAAGVLYFIEKKELGITGIFMILFDILVQIYTASRGGFIGMLIILGVFAWFKYKALTENSQMDSAFRLILIMLAVIAVIVYFVFIGQINVFGLLKRSQDSFSYNTMIRIYLWTAAVRAITSSLKTFLFGIGLNISETVGAFSPAYLETRLYGNIHNAYLHLALVYGVPSLTIIMVYLGRSLISGLAYIKGRFEGNTTMQILSGTVLSLLVVNLVETDMLSRTFEGTVVWIFAGYIYALYKVEKSEKTG